MSLRNVALRSGLLCVAGGVLALGGCMVSPPAASLASPAGTVRAPSPARAAEVSAMLERLAPRVLGLLPDSRAAVREVWVQDTPALYSFQTSAYSDADGFWAEGAARIHLRDRADNVERTLAHELVHASLGSSWKTLPGTLEEGLCDYVSTVVCPNAAARLCSGRLSSAAFATGGLVLELELLLPAEDPDLASEVGYAARLRLDGDPPVRVDPLRTFAVHAGLSSSDVAPEEKKAFYGLSFLVVRRIVERVGIDGLHEVCTQATSDGLSSVPVERLLAAAGLDDRRETWRAAIRSEIGPSELFELVRNHPEFIVQPVVRFLEPYHDPELSLGLLGGLSARVSVQGSDLGVTFPTLVPLRQRVESALLAAQGSGLEVAQH